MSSSPSLEPDLPLPQAGNVVSTEVCVSSSSDTNQLETTDGSQPQNDDIPLPPPPPLPTRRNRDPLASSDAKPATGCGPSIRADSLKDLKSSRTLPPRPPQRSRTLPQSTSSSNDPCPRTPPPLPTRRAIVSVYEDTTPPAGAPDLHPPENAVSLETVVEPPKPNRRGSLPPPPKQRVGLKDGLPGPKRPQQPPDSSDDDEEPKTGVDHPDSSRSSRKPPCVIFYPHSESHISLPHNGVYAVAGGVVAVVSSHTVKLFDLATSESLIRTLDLKDITPDRCSRRPTSLAFRNTRTRGEKATLLWIGTMDGHLFEVEVHSPTLVSSRMAAHAQAITHIFSIDRTMVTVDDDGNALVFASDNSQDFVLSDSQPRMVRVADKQDFVKLMAGRLWTSTREQPSGIPDSSRGPAVRVYDVFTLGSPGKYLLPTERVRTVTCGTTLPSNPGYVYLGHEGGTITIWALEGGRGVPECVDVVKVATSDILCLAGVNDRLWGGSRAGQICAYDTRQKPWVVTNSWVAHQGAPVTQLFVDPWSVSSVGKLCVVSVGRDEKLRFWDGLLAVSWIDQELMARQDKYSSYRGLRALIVSWNVCANAPDALTGDPNNVDFLKDVLTSADSPDIISICFQEVVDLAKGALLGTMSQEVSDSYQRWHDRLVRSVRLAHRGTPYYVAHSESLAGLYSCTFVKVSERASIKDTRASVVKCGAAGGNLGDKGAIATRFVIADSSVCFVNCHLAAGQDQVLQRGRDIATILEARALFPQQSNFDPCVFVNGGDGTMALDNEIVFFSGDLNYRISVYKEVVIASIRSGTHRNLQAHDQLLKQMKFAPGFRLRSFQEGPIDFIPTYKYDLRTNEFDTSSKQRTPAWCDRILWRVLDNSRVVQTQYRRWEANISDHRPVSAVFNLSVKSINPAARVTVKNDIETEWAALQERLLSDLQKFYVD